MAECRFDKCKGECCGYVSVYIDTPRAKADFDEIKWFTAHENVTVYRDHDQQWIVEFVTPCAYLDESFMCKVYGSHPDVCSAYNPDDCTFNTKGIVWDKYRFTCPDDVADYLEARKLKKAAKKKKAKRKAKNKDSKKKPKQEKRRG
jgi:Fe-S-cluster containining protein